MAIAKIGTKHTVAQKDKISIAGKERYRSTEERQKTSEFTKIAMRRPEVRKRHIEGLHHSQWLKVRTDKGQLELLDKWNRLGFKFLPNFQIHTNTDLFYVDGYDPTHRVVLEYDGKYHLNREQQKKDLNRQEKIIAILDPKKFWRYNAVSKTFTNILGE